MYVRPYQATTKPLSCVWRLYNSHDLKGGALLVVVARWWCLWYVIEELENTWKIVKLLKTFSRTVCEASTQVTICVQITLHWIYNFSSHLNLLVPLSRTVWFHITILILQYIKGYISVLFRFQCNHYIAISWFLLKINVVIAFLSIYGCYIYYTTLNIYYTTLITLHYCKQWPGINTSKYSNRTVSYFNRIFIYVINREEKFQCHTALPLSVQITENTIFLKCKSHNSMSSFCINMLY